MKLYVFIRGVSSAYGGYHINMIEGFIDSLRNAISKVSVASSSLPEHCLTLYVYCHVVFVVKLPFKIQPLSQRYTNVMSV